MSLRTRAARVMAIGALTLAASAVPVARVAACDCMPMAPADAAAAADVAFSGTVVGEQPVAGGRPGPMLGAAQAVYAFEVDGVAKGDVGATAEVVSGGDGASCGMSFVVGDRWLIFGTHELGALTTHLCAGNVALAPDEPAPIEVSAPRGAPAETSGPAVPIGVLVPALALLALAAASGYLFWRADRAS